ncbi:ATP-binding protein [Neobacillus drentensis]|uniref:two-component system histidine kinase PnpS n=1 Tax=Neobacillus drentensis TaxID=220684 RepID=UPI003001DFE0
MTKFRNTLVIIFIIFIFSLFLGLGVLLGQLFNSSFADTHSDLQKIEIMRTIFIFVVIFLVLIIYLGMRTFSRYTKPIVEATNVAIELTEGNYQARTKVNGSDKTGMLGTSINRLAQNLQELVKSQEIQQEHLSVLIENMGSGLVLIDSRGYITLINKGFIDIFKGSPTDYLENLYYEVINQEEVCNLVTEVFRTEKHVSKQLLIPLFIERRYFAVYGVPIIRTNNVWKGVLLVFHDITELKKLEQVRKDFVANVSHELKTPVTSIKGFTETLLDGAMNNKDTLKYFLSIILKESGRLQSLIQDLLELSKIEQQGFKLDIQEMDLYKLLKEVITLLNGKAEAKDINLDLICKEEQVQIKGDVNRLKQVFINLINNAITYTPTNGNVKVLLFDNGNIVQIHVKDTGIGMKKEEIPRIFERFYRVDRARSRNSGGTGLGLAIVKHLIEAHQGKISVTSEIGEGSEFIIELNK